MLRNKKLLIPALLVVAVCAALAVFCTVRQGIYAGMERHRKYTMYIGLNDGDTGIQQVTTAQAREILNDIAGKYTDGYTLYEADGFWREDGSTFSEHTLVCVMIDVPEQAVKSIMNETLKALNQHSILLEAGDSWSMYYSGE